MRKIISYMHMSLDGYVAAPIGDMKWIKVDEEIFNYIEMRIKETDAALYGRKTYEMMEAYWPTAADKPGASRHDINHSRWYKNAHKIVLSKTTAADNVQNTTIIKNNLAERINEIKHQAGPEILIFGSPSATHALMQQNLVDGYCLFVNPIVLGKGMRLFENVRDQIKLHLLNTKQFTSGVTELNYIVNNE